MCDDHGVTLPGPHKQGPEAVGGVHLSHSGSLLSHGTRTALLPVHNHLPAGPNAPYVVVFWTEGNECAQLSLPAS